jgi:glutamate-ammonia-ligase adenylyltransferase
MFSLEKIPAELHHTVNLHLQNFTQSVQALNLKFPENKQVKNTLPSIFCCSEFIAQTCHRQPSFLFELIDSGDLFSANVRQTYQDQLNQKIIANDAELMKFLRQFRNKQMLPLKIRETER